jgi:hypothetical protein
VYVIGCFESGAKTDVISDKIRFTHYAIASYVTPLFGAFCFSPLFVVKSSGLQIQRSRVRFPALPDFSEK